MPRGRKKKETDEKLLSFSAKFSPWEKERLDALAFITKESAYVIVQKALREYWGKLPKPLKEKVETMIRMASEESAP